MPDGPPQPAFVHSLLPARDWQDRPQLSQLCDWWKSAPAGICALVGIGGSGKTAIAERFLRLLPRGLPPLQNLPKRPDLPPPSALFVFSFYLSPNPESFFARLHAWLHNHDYDESAPIPSYEHVLDAVAKAPPLLLILDGLEKTQDDGIRSGHFGQILDGRLRDLVLRAADGFLPNLAMLITTRFPLHDPKTARSFHYHEIPIHQLDPATAIALLRARGVARGTDHKLDLLASQHGYHAITVDLLGGYIAHFCDGDPDKLPHLDQPPHVPQDESDLDPRVPALRQQERQFTRVAQRYAESLAKSDPAVLALLQRVCLFRLGATADTLASIFLGQAKEGISGPPLAALTPRQLQHKFDLLTAMRLLDRTIPSSPGTPLSPSPGTPGEGRGEGSAQEPRPNNHLPSPAPAHPALALRGTTQPTYTLHPAVRDGFALDTAPGVASHEAIRKTLTASLPEKLRGDEGALRIAHLLGTSEYPSDPAVLDLLEEIIHHTLAAGHPQEAWDIYWNRLGEYKNLGWRLGAYERAERICRAFSPGQPPESAPLPSGLSEDAQAAFINDWALYLDALGRLDAAGRCYEQQIRMRMRRENWRNASTGNQNLADVRLLAGRLRLALPAAEEALALADRANDTQSRRNSYAYRAYARALRGHIPAAIVDFAQALHWQHEDEADRNLPLYSLRGIRHTQLLIRLGRLDEAAQLAERNREILQKEGGPEHQDIPRCNLILADIARLQGDLSKSRDLLFKAHDWAIPRSAKEVLCWSALLRAQIERDANNTPAARSAIQDGLRIARDCGYGILHIDLLLESAQLHLLAGDSDSALSDLRVALDVGHTPPPDSGYPILLPAAHEDCGYAWAIAQAQHLRAQALLLQAAQKLNRPDFAPANFDKLPKSVQELITSARAHLNDAAQIRQRIQDPKLNDTNTLLTKLSQGQITTYPLTPIVPPPPLEPPSAQKQQEIPMPASPHKYHAFLSYRHTDPDQSFALQLLKDLESAGFKVAIDIRDFAPNIPFVQEIERCIKQSAYTLAVISPRYLQSGNTEEEAVICKTLGQAERKRRLIPLTIEKTNPLPIWLYDLTGLDFVTPNPLIHPLNKLKTTLQTPP